ncbi:uncharacterized protein LOC105847324 isoform X2 [Hydra vulgaris]|uniref:Uncharacterized protein LOC105847324 isoform X2 n=1 Tax=Hydra vulgaris TaxID=6087 RepID=A0ABM4BHI5_HYDVU
MKIYFFLLYILHQSLGIPLTPCNPVNCLVNPCQFYQCPNGYQCVPNYCNGCNAVCKPCKMFTCFIDPCKGYRCPAGSQCIPNNCNGCYAVCKYDIMKDSNEDKIDE